MKTLRVRAVEGRLVARENVRPPDFLGATATIDGTSVTFTWDTNAVHEVPATHYYRAALAAGDLSAAPAVTPARTAPVATPEKP